MAVTPKRYFRIPDSIWSVVEEYALKSRTTPSHVARMILAEWVWKQCEEPRNDPLGGQTNHSGGHRAHGQIVEIELFGELGRGLVSGILKALGVRIRRVADLEEGAIYYHQDRLLLLDFEMTDADVQGAIEDVLPVAWYPDH